MNRIIPISLALITLIGLSACSTQATPTHPALKDVQGSVTVPRLVTAFYSLHAAAGDPCVAKAGYDDISAGSQATVSDVSGTTIGFASLNSGVVSDNDPLGSGMLIYCEFDFTIDKLPYKSIYSVAAGGAQRGPVKFSIADVKASGFAVSVG